MEIVEIKAVDWANKRVCGGMGSDRAWEDPSGKQLQCARAVVRGAGEAGGSVEERGS